MAQQHQENNTNVLIKTEEPDVEGDLNMPDLHNPSISENDEHPNGAAAPVAAPLAAAGGSGLEAGVLPGLGGVEPGIHAPPPIPRKDKNLREFLAAMDEYAPIVSRLL